MENQGGAQPGIPGRSRQKLKGGRPRWGSQGGVDRDSRKEYTETQGGLDGDPRETACCIGGRLLAVSLTFIHSVTCDKTEHYL